MKDCLVNFFSWCIVPDTFGYSSFVYAKQLGQGCEVCTWGKVPNTHCQLYSQANACVLFGFAAVAVFPASEKKRDRVTVKTLERYSDARCKRNLIQSNCRHIWIQSMSEQDHGHKTNASLQRGHCCPSSQCTQYPSYYSSRVIWSNYLTASGKENVPGGVRFHLFLYIIQYDIAIAECHRETQMSALCEPDCCIISLNPTWSQVSQFIILILMHAGLP